MRARRWSATVVLPLPALPKTKSGCSGGAEMAENCWASSNAVTLGPCLVDACASTALPLAGAFAGEHAAVSHDLAQFTALDHYDVTCFEDAFGEAARKFF